MRWLQTFVGLTLDKAPAYASWNMTAREPDVLIIGAGAAGLAAARDLARAGRNVVLLEARNRIGGRIHTIREKGWPLPVELGAEFVHGRPPETWDIIRGAGLAPCDVSDSHHWLEDGTLRRLDDFWSEVEAILGRLDKVEPEDMTFTEFLDRFCTDASPRARQLSFAFVEGFDAADPSRVSARSLAQEQQASEEIDEEQMFRLIGGYDRVPQELLNGCDHQHLTLRLEENVTEVRWTPGQVRAVAASGTFSARTALITLPLGVLKAGAVRFLPDLPEKRRAADQLEMGPVMKVVLRFDEAFWETERLPTVPRGQSLREACFLHARGPLVFTWWTLLPVRAAVWVGWSGGPSAAALSHRPGTDTLDAALSSLGQFLGVPKAALAGRLESWHIHDWQADPLSRGAYSYTLVGGTDAHRALAHPVQDTLFFAGEATHEGQSGTVAGALASGARAAREVLRALSS